jgi:hypothetical protein
MVLLTVFALAMSVGISASGSTPQWVIQPTAQPAGDGTRQFTSVSCTSPTACIAVGTLTYNRGRFGHTLAEAWNGSRWNVQSTPDPAGAQGSYLSGISCSSPAACTAVGWYQSRRNLVYSIPLIEVWNGTRWAIQPTQIPARPLGSQLFDVSCASPTACTAVGTNGGNSLLAERWDGSRWTIQPAPDPTPGGDPAFSNFYGVSCSSVTHCTAVGDYDKNFANVPLAEVWNGFHWTVQPTPSPIPAGVSALSTLHQVSCTSAIACTAVGSAPDGAGGSVLLVEAWNGSRWTIEPTPQQGGQLYGVACTTSTACLAVGAAPDGLSASTPLAEAWNGTHWTIQPIAIPAAPPASELSGVACSSVTACTAVGGNNNSTLVESRAG